MNNQGRISRSLFSISICILFSGCFVVETVTKPITDFGNGVLQFVGLVPEDSEQGAGEGLVKAMQNLNREEEYYLGRAVAARLLSMYQESTDLKLINYVNKVGQVVARSSSRPNTFAGYNFSVIQSDAANAYAAPGGFIFVTEGLIRILPDEDALASVLSHEIAHVALKHGEKAISEKNLNDSILSIGQLAGSLSCVDIVQHASIIFGSAVEDIVGQLLTDGYSRDQEREADVEGIKTLQASGYKPSSALEVMALLRAGSSADEGGWFSSHPDVEEREKIMADLQIEDSEKSISGYQVRKQRFQKAAGVKS